MGQQAMFEESEVISSGPSVVTAHIAIGRLYIYIDSLHCLALQWYGVCHPAFRVL